MKNHYIQPDTVFRLSPFISCGTFTIEQVKGEIDFVLSALPETLTEFPDDWDDDEISHLIFRFAQTGNALAPSREQLVEKLQACPSEGVAVLSKYLNQIRLAVDEAGTYSGSGFDQTEILLLPLAWSERFDYLLNQRCVPVAWVQRIDASLF